MWLPTGVWRIEADFPDDATSSRYAVASCVCTRRTPRSDRVDAGQRGAISKCSTHTSSHAPSPLSLRLSELTHL